MFTRAERKTTALKIAFTGVSGAGKTYSAILFARGYVGDSGRIAVIDTENGSASLYANLTAFDVCNIKPRLFDIAGGNKTTSFSWVDFLSPIDFAVQNYDALIIDSASTIWDGTLEYKTRVDNNGGNSFTNWGKAKDTYKAVQNKILQAPIPVFCCLRSKMEYSLEEDDKGKKVPKKLGLAPVASPDAEYDFSVVFDIDRSHNATVSKSRCDEFTDEFNEQITIATGSRLRNWIDNLN